jgi:carnitine-CoA ligase
MANGCRDLMLVDREHSTMNTDRARTLGGLLRAQALTRGEAPFVHFEGHTLSYAAMDARVTRAAQGFASIGVAHGARVCIALPNGIDFLLAWFGLARLGAIEVPINLEFKGPQVKYVVEDAGAEILITSVSFLAEHRESLDECAGLHTVVLVDEAPGVLPSIRLTIRRFGDMLASECNLEALRPVLPSDPVAILYTSGTTGSPKGVLLCHEHEITIAESVAKSIELTSHDCSYNFFPLHHNTAQGIITCSALVAGAQMLLVDRFSRSRFWQDVQAYRCTAFFGMGAILEMLNKDSDGPALAEGHALRIGWGIAMGVEQVKRFTDLFGVEFITGYGSTEVNMVSMTSRHDPKPGSVGKLLDDFEVAIVDERDQPLPRGTVGEIVVRPRRPFITFLEYWGRPQQTVEAWRNLWMHTGDAGRIDEDGYLYFVDRIKDVIRYRGNNVSSLEVENILLDFPSMQEAAVIPAPSELGGYEQEIQAVLVLAEGQRLDAKAIIEHCSGKLPYYAVPRFLDIVDALPKTATGKVRKTELRARGLSAGTFDRVAAGIAVRSHEARGPSR